jgi:hypothetical protein
LVKLQNLKIALRCRAKTEEGWLVKKTQRKSYQQFASSKKTSNFAVPNPKYRKITIKTR